MPVPRYTVGQLALRHGLSRSTLLYYDRIGILTPASRSRTGYRNYDERDEQRLAMICRYRRAGLALTTIQELLSGTTTAETGTETGTGRQMSWPGQLGDAGESGDGMGTRDSGHPSTQTSKIDPGTVLTEAMAARLETINQEMHALRQQQRFILAYLNGGRDLSAMTFLNGRRFIGLFESAGIDQRQRDRWHAAYERVDGTEHQAFLEFLCLPEDVITAVRTKAAADPATP